MGTEVEPGEKGDDCLLLYPAGETPKYLLIDFSGIGKCPGFPVDPANGVHILTQDPVSPCRWEKKFGNFVLEFFVHVGESNVHMHYLGWIFFLSSVLTVPFEHFINQIQCTGPPPFDVGGTAYVDLYDFPGRAYQQAVDFNLMPVAYTKFEVWPVPDEPAYVSVRRFGNIRTPTNVAIKFDATHYDQWEMFEKES